MRLFRSFYHQGPDVDALVDLVGLSSTRSSLVLHLSGGQKQRLSIACALAGEPDLLFLDEPTTGLDPQSRRQLQEMLGAFRRKGGTILLTTHYMDAAQALCDRVAIVDQGRTIAQDTPQALISARRAEGGDARGNPRRRVHGPDGPSSEGGVGAPRRRASPALELTLARVREFFREPEAIFWAFVFPLVLTLTLAAASASAADRQVTMGVVDATTAPAIQRALEAAPGLRVVQLAAADHRRALRDGTVHIVVVPADPPTDRYDTSKGESPRARVAVPGSRYVDWLIPGLIGMGIVTNGLWAVAFLIVSARLRKLLKRMMASPMRRWEYLLAQLLARLIVLVPEATLPLAFGGLALG